jgi:hypothetical protein
MAYTIVVHHWIIMFNIVAFVHFTLSEAKLASTSVFSIENHIKYKGHETSSAFGISLSTNHEKS